MKPDMDAMNADAPKACQTHDYRHAVNPWGGPWECENCGHAVADDDMDAVPAEWRARALAAEARLAAPAPDAYDDAKQACPEGMLR